MGNKIGPKAEPCGTPQAILVADDMILNKRHGFSADKQYIS